MGMFPNITAAEWPSDWQYFSHLEMMCAHSGECRVDPELMKRLMSLRGALGFALPVNSGFRHPVKHPIEARKSRPGTHALGCAADIAVAGERAWVLVAAARDHGFTGIGISQQLGTPLDRRFIHLDIAPPRPQAPRPHLWSYR